MLEDGKDPRKKRKEIRVERNWESCKVRVYWKVVVGLNRVVKKSLTVKMTFGKNCRM